MDVDPSLGLLSPEMNPDAYSVVSEYIDYTEYLHCDITRSLGLINKLDRDYGLCATAVHEVASDYCALAEGNSLLDSTPAASLERVKDLRRGIANPLNSGLVGREESVAEAIRLYETVDRHFNRLSDIIRHLQKINVVPRPDLVPETTKIGGSTQSDSQMRITLRLDGQRRASLLSPSTRHAHVRSSATPIRMPNAARKRTVTRVLDEKAKSNLSSRKGNDVKLGNNPQNLQQLVLDSSSESDWDDPPNPQPVISDADRKSSITHRFTEQGEHLPWFELQPQELAILRKRMKKNSSWQPSDAMMLKQLEMLGRGVRGFRKWARRTGQSKEDIERVLEGGDNSTGGLAIGALKRSQDNKGMRLNVMKRAKREREKAEAAAAAAAQGVEDSQNLGDGADSKFEPTNRQRSNIRRSSIQTTNTTQEDHSPSAKTGPNSKNRVESGSRRPASGGAINTSPSEKAEIRQPHTTRKLRKPLAGESSGNGGDYGKTG
ncbi:hypothetical protein ABW20_dc0106378 [Dactylellina cionopaga]|nr:hypothetical protein ABW20_dc0106378 [Dactylellina cionopaga]